MQNPNDGASDKAQAAQGVDLTDEHATEQSAQADGEPVDDRSGSDAALQRLETQLRDCEEDKLRLAAEMDNLRRRTAREVESAHKFALEKFMNDLLAVVDSLEKGLEACENGDGALESIVEGTRLTHRQLHQVLEKHGLEALDPAGERFDPEQHEALTLVPSEEHEPNTVQQVIRKGYRLNGRLVRPAQVIVTRKP